MNAVLAIIANGGQAIVVIYTGRRNICFLLYFIDSDKTLHRRPRPTPCKEAPGPPSKPWRWRGKRLCHGGDVCVLVFS